MRRRHSWAMPLQKQFTPRQLEPLEARRVLATFQVTADAADGEPGSLRAAIVAANRNGEDDTIELAAGVYRLTVRNVNEPQVDDAAALNATGGDLDLLEVGQQIVIRGADANSTIVDASDLRDRVFEVASGVVAVFDGLTIQGGTARNSGGGINVTPSADVFDTSLVPTGSVTVRNSIVRNNSATYEGGGINNWGPLTLVNSQFIDNFADYEGGGIEHNGGGHASIVDSTFTGNRTNYEGGGVSVGTWTVGATTISIENSTLANNRASYSGGGLDVEAADVTVVNSTFSNNLASFGGSINNWRGRVRLDHVTVVNARSNSNSVEGSVSASNSIFTGSDYSDVGDGFRSLGHNLIGRIANDRIRRQNAAEVIGSDLQLGPLADNGGASMTHALLLGSPAIDAASSDLVSDQRGQRRPHDGDGNGEALPDIGAFEAPRLTVYRVNSVFDRIEINPGDGLVDTGTPGEVTLRAAIMEANALGQPVRIVLPAGDLQLTIGREQIPDGQMNEPSRNENASLLDDLDVHGVVQIVGAGSDATSLGGTQLNGLLEVHAAASVSLTGLSIRNGHTDGGILNHGQLILQDVTLEANSSSSDAGGAITNHGHLQIAESIVRNNRTADGGAGGGIANHGQLTVKRSTIEANSTGAAGRGGGLANFGEATIEASTFSHNEAGIGGEGGAIFSGVYREENGDGNSEQARLQLTNSTLSGNRLNAEGRGAGIVVRSGNANILSSTIVENATHADVVPSERGVAGGIVIVDGARLQIANSVIAMNDAAQIVGQYENNSFNFVDGDPMLGPLQDNGGPTQTHLPRMSSPLIDRGAAFGLQIDQRGEPRTFDDPRVSAQMEVGQVPIHLNDFDDEESTEFVHYFDGTDIGSVEASYALLFPESEPDRFYAFGAFSSVQRNGQPTSVLDNDHWTGPLEAILVDSPTNGEITLAADGTFLYVPSNGFLGQDQFTYVARNTATAAGEPRVVGLITVATIEILPAASITVQSYIDRDHDGVFSDTDAGLAGTRLTLAGVDQFGVVVYRAAETDSRGTSHFADLAPGEYTVTKTQPALLAPGAITLGTAGGAITAANQFTISLAAGAVATDYSFAELRSVEPQNPAPIPPLAVGIPRPIGDANHDGRFDSSDLVLIFQHGHFADGIANNSDFEHGDWNGDGEFDSADLVLAFQSGTYARAVDAVISGS